MKIFNQLFSHRIGSHHIAIGYMDGKIVGGAEANSINQGIIGKETPHNPLVMRTEIIDKLLFPALAKIRPLKEISTQ